MWHEIRTGRGLRHAITVCCASLLLPLLAQGQLITLYSDGSATYAVDPQAVISAQNLVVTSNPGVFTGPDIAPIIGADTFYTNGFTGAGTIAANIEGGHIWQGHETLGHVTTRVNEAGVPVFTHVTPAFDRHATQVGMMIGGRVPNDPDPVTRGISFDTDLRSGAIATNWSGNAYSMSFGATFTSLVFPYANGGTRFGIADSINSSWGVPSVAGSAEAAGTDGITMLLDGLANQNPRTTLVVAAGNSGGTVSPMVAAPASGYNGISVGALANSSNVYDSVASFSSRGPGDYRDPSLGASIPAATARRATVDIVAPGENLTSAFYGGQSGGNDPILTGSVASGGPTSYSGGLNGTSFAAPITAGGVTLMHQAAAALGLPADAEDTRVIKANLMNAARKIPGWSNGQTPHPNGNGGVITTDALDLTSGAGALDLTRTYEQFLTGQTDIPGTIGGVSTQAVGWDFGSVSLGGSNDVIIAAPMGGEFRATLTWFRERTTDPDTLVVGDLGFANLDLQVWDATLTTLISESVSTYSETEHLAFTLPADGLYALRVAYPANLFGSITSEEYALAWYGTLVPEPSAAALVSLLAMVLCRRRPTEYFQASRKKSTEPARDMRG